MLGKIESQKVLAKASRRSLLYLATTILTATTLSPAFGQATSAGSSVSLAEPEGPDEIVVTAQKRSEKLLDVPVAISAFTGQALESIGVEGVQGLQFATPALVYPSTGAYAQPYIRGVGNRLLQNGLDPSVATYIDGRYISRQSSDVFDLADIERVEVLKGPQGVLFGRNSSAGAIRVITKDVIPDFDAFAKGSVGNYGTWILSGMVNVPVSDKWGIRVSGETSHRDGIAHNIASTGTRDWNDKNFNEIRAKMKWAVTDRLDANLSVSYAHRSDNDGNAYVALPPLKYNTGIALGGLTGTDVRHVATTVDGTIDIKEFAGEFDLNYQLDDFSIKSITTYAHLDNLLPFDGDGTSAVLVDALVFEKPDTVSQELNITSNTGIPIEWLAGAYFFNDDTGFDTTVATGARITSQGVQIVDTNAYAAFGQFKWHITDALSLIVGGRYSYETKDVKILPSVRPGARTIPALPYANHVKFNKFTPAATLQYSFNDSMVYAKFAQGFKSGGFNYPAKGSPVLHPEVLNMYELGYKGSLFDKSVVLTVSGYYYDYNDLQVTRAATQGVGVSVVTTNAASALAYGLDGDVSWHVTRDFTLNGAVSAEYSEYTSFLADAKAFIGIVRGTSAAGMTDVGYNADGKPLLRAPKFSGFLSGTYAIPLENARLPVTVSYAYKGSFNFDFVADPSTGILRQKGYSLVNARVGYAPSSGRWSAAIYASNLTDARYFNDVVAAATGIRGQFGLPRTYGAEFQYNF